MAAIEEEERFLASLGMTAGSPGTASDGLLVTGAMPDFAVATTSRHSLIAAIESEESLLARNHRWARCSSFKDNHSQAVVRKRPAR